MEYWNQRSFCLITGASRGIGREIAVQFSTKVGPGSVFLILARSASGLDETKALMNSSPDLQIVTSTVDLSNPNPADYYSLINSALQSTGTKAQDFDHSILVHNAGSLGNIQLRVNQLENLDELRQYYDFNLISMILLNSQFFKVFTDEIKQRSIIQITSLGAVSPFKTWGMYCAGKAARDSLMKSIALEEGINTINWSPGPVETDIYSEAIQNTGDPDVAKLFKDSRAEGTVLTTNQTITKLVKVLAEGKFTKGEHVDYFDIE